MDAGADASAGWRGCHGRTLLGAAAAGKSKKIVLALLLAGAKDEVNVTFGENQESALHVAAAKGAEATSRVLMTSGADPNLRSAAPPRNTPLYVAVREGHDGVVGLLLLKRALPNATMASGKQTALHLAAVMGHELCVSELLLAGADKDSCDVYGKTPLLLAANNNRLGVVEQLLVAGANVDVRGPYGLSALDVAANNRHVNVVRALLRYGSSVEAPDGGCGYTPLHNAVVGGGSNRNNRDIVKSMLEAGADLEAKTTVAGLPPLHLIAYRQSGTICALLESGASVNARDKEGWTPLHVACSSSCIDHVELLLRWGTDETLVDDSGSTPANQVGWQDGDDEERKADDQRIRHMLARAPADRAWRRRGWLVLARSRPHRVQLVNDSRTSDGGSSTKVAWARGGVSGGGDGDGTRNRRVVDLDYLVGTVVGLDVEGVFRLVVGFL